MLPMRLRILGAAVVALGMGVWAGEAQAEIVFLTSGRSVSVKGHRVDGDRIILTLRTGGEVTCDRSLIDKILPDEVPYPSRSWRSRRTRPAKHRLRRRGRSCRRRPTARSSRRCPRRTASIPLLVRALIQVESNYQTRARSPKGAMGLMQLMPSTARVYRVRNPFDPRTNIEAGIKHLKSLIDRFGRVELGLAAYNAGEGAVTKFNGIPPYRETRNYVSRILSLAGIK